MAAAGSMSCAGRERDAGVAKAKRSSLRTREALEFRAGLDKSVGIFAPQQRVAQPASLRDCLPLAVDTAS